MRLYLDDVRNPPNDGIVWTVCRTVKEAQAFLMTGQVEEATLDHDLDLCPECHPEVEPGFDAQEDVLPPCRHAVTGYDLVKWMVETGCWPKTKPRVHSANPVGALAMRQVIDRYWPSRESY